MARNRDPQATHWTSGLTLPVVPLGPKDLDALLEEDRRAGGAHGEEGPEPTYPALRRQGEGGLAQSALQERMETDLEEIDRSILRFEAQISDAKWEVGHDREEEHGRIQEHRRYREELGPEAARLRRKVSGKLHLLLALTITLGELVAGYAAWLILDLAEVPTWMLAAVSATILYLLGAAIGIQGKESDTDVARKRIAGNDRPGAMARTLIIASSLVSAIAVAAAVAMLRSFYVEHAADAVPVSGPLLWLAFGAIPAAMFVAAIALEYHAHDREASLEKAVERARDKTKASTARLADLESSAAGERACREHAERRWHHILAAQGHLTSARVASLYTGYVGVTGEPLGNPELPSVAEPVLELAALDDPSFPGSAPAFLLLEHLNSNGHGGSEP